MTQPPFTQANENAFRNNRPSSSFVTSPCRETLVRNAFHCFQSTGELCATLANESLNSVLLPRHSTPATQQCTALGTKPSALPELHLLQYVLNVIRSIVACRY